MEFLFILPLCALVFAVCWFVDKGFTKVFRSKQQHLSGLSVRLNKRFATIGIILGVLGIAALMGGLTDTPALLAGGVILLVIGVGLIVYYLSTGIFYDDNTFLHTSFGKQSQEYRYNQIRSQKLYMVQGGSIIVELYMTDGKAIQVLSQMPDFDKFLDHAFAGWCRQKGIDPERCDFHNTQECRWFPEEGEHSCIFPRVPPISWNW